MSGSLGLAQLQRRIRGVSCGCGFSAFPFVSLDHILSDADTSIPLRTSIDGHLDRLQFGALTLPGFRFSFFEPEEMWVEPLPHLFHESGLPALGWGA